MDYELIFWPFLLFYVGCALGFASLARTVLSGWRARRVFVELRKQGLVRKAHCFYHAQSDEKKPMPKHSMFLGHLLAIKPYVDRLPSDAHGFLAFGHMAKKYPGGIFYLDMWPFIGPIMICTSATAATQATQKTILAAKKPKSLHAWFYSIAGGPNLFTMQEDEWRPWRNVFNPGFSQAHLFSLVPDIVRETLEYRKTLEHYAAEGSMFQLDEVTLWFTMDLIGAIVLYASSRQREALAILIFSREAHLDSRRTKNPLATALLSQLHWKLSGQELNLLERWNPVRPVIEWLNSRQMNSYIGKELDQRYAEYSTNLALGNTSQSKSVISLVLKDYLEQKRAKKPSPILDRIFRSYATSQIRTFLFAGHDTTSSTICHMYYLLSKNPSALEKLRAEHDLVLGTDVNAAASLLSSNSHLLNQLAYTLAVIKETMRLFPPASGIRQGVEGVTITGDDGQAYPTGKTMVWILHQAMQRHPSYWKQPNDFLPERWLVGPDDPLYPVKGAWRPFEYGPRNCIGQGLVILELKVVLALTVREFDVRDAYKEYDRLHPRKGIMKVEGERAYQIEKGGAHPADRFPCRVYLRTLRANDRLL